MHSGSLCQLTPEGLFKGLVKDVFDIVHIGHGFIVAISIHASQGDLPLAHGESILLLALDDVLVRDHLRGPKTFTRETISKFRLPLNVFCFFFVTE